MTAHKRRWPATIAMMLIIGLQFGLPDQVVPSWWPVLFGLQVLLLLPLLATNPVKLTTDHPLLRATAVTLCTLLLAANAFRLVQLILVLVHHQQLAATELLSVGAVIWVTNVVATAIGYWELDRGGPFARDPSHPRQEQEIDLVFPQMTGMPGVDADSWRPAFVDYLFVAFTSATAFSPTDTMPITGRAKLLMMAASTVSLVTIAGVAARAVNVL